MKRYGPPKKVTVQDAGGFIPVLPPEALEFLNNARQDLIEERNAPLVNMMRGEQGPVLNVFDRYFKEVGFDAFDGIDRNVFLNYTAPEFIAIMRDQGFDAKVFLSGEYGVAQTNPERMQEKGLEVNANYDFASLKDIAQTSYVSTAGDKTRFNFNVAGKAVHGSTISLNSSPNGLIQIRGWEIDMDAKNPLIIDEVLLLRDEEKGGQYVIASLVNEIIDTISDGFKIALQISARTIEHQATGMNHIESTSYFVEVPGTITLPEPIQPERRPWDAEPEPLPPHYIKEGTILKYKGRANDVLTYFDEWIRFLLTREGDEHDRYRPWWVDHLGLYLIYGVKVIIIPYRKRGGGCNNPGWTGPPKTFLPFIAPMTSVDNNCFFESILTLSPEILEDPKITKEDCIRYWREVGNYPPKTPVYFEKHHAEILNRFLARIKLSIIIWGYVKNEVDPGVGKGIGVLFNAKHGTKDLHLLFIKRGRLGHFYPVSNINGIRHRISCKSCCDWFANQGKSFEDHVKSCQRCKCGDRLTKNHRCNIERRQSQFYKMDLPKPKINTKLSKETWQKNVWFADFETFHDQKLKNPDTEAGIHLHTVYAAGCCRLEDINGWEDGSMDPKTAVRHRDMIGETALRTFMDFIITQKGSCWFWNGARFDNYFMIQDLISRGIPVKDVLKDKTTTRILSFSVGKMVFKDLCQFVLCSLASACEGFALPARYIKGDFDHKLITEWEDVYFHFENIADYLVNDVASMAIIYKTFASTIFTKFGINMNDYLSLSHMADGAFRAGLSIETQKLLITPTKEVYDYLSRAVYGGRVYPSIPSEALPITKTEIYKNWEKLSMEEREGHYEAIRSTDDHLKYFDVVSLYPYVAAETEFPIGTYYFIQEARSIQPYFQLLQRNPNTWSVEEDKNIRKCFFRVDVTCPKNIFIPFLMSRGKKFGNLEQNLLDKEDQVYDGLTLKTAISLGYTITKIYDILHYSHLVAVCKKYMTICFDEKSKAGKGTALYLIWKILANSLYGKFTQAIIDNKIGLYLDDNPILKMSDADLRKIRKIEVMIDHGRIVGYFMETLKTDAVCSKVRQIGAVILGASRIHMHAMYNLFSSYTNPRNIIRYNDTDSLVVPISAQREISMEQRKKYFGKKLGQLDDELPESVIVRFISLAPKTYYIEYIDGKTFERWAIIKTKGIPQPNRLFDKKTHHFNLSKYDPIEDWKELVDHPQIGELRDIYYTLCQPTGEILDYARVITGDWFQDLIDKKFIIICRYGSIEKKIVDQKIQGINYFPVRIKLTDKRSMNANWWQSGKRNLAQIGDLIISVPAGFTDPQYKILEKQ